jgi:homoserine O-acetyltransferase/O-succinyltransferase
MRNSAAALCRCILIALAASAGAASAQPLAMADLHSCATAAGPPVAECRIGYRTFGTLNAQRDNAVLIPSWYGGTSSSLQRLLGADAMVDTTKYFVVLVDALGNGISTSPSNSAVQPGAAYPRITIGDMVAAQRRLVRDHLRISRLHAVLGFSMGAMQALEWAVRYPDDVYATVAIAGTPRPSPHDLFTWRALRWAVHLAERGGLPADSAHVLLADLWHVIRATPAQINAMDRLDVADMAYRDAAKWRDFDHDDHRLQLDALMTHDVATSFAGDLVRAAAAIRGPMLIVVSPDDRIVGPEAALHFAELAGAEVLAVASECGHFALYCEPVVAARVRSFLQAPAGATVAGGPRGGP